MRLVTVGNDVVDLANPRCAGRAGNVRFVERVFAAAERAVIGAARDRDLELWCHWAAKEAGFKAITKAMGAAPPFVHSRFAVAWADRACGEGRAPDGVLREGWVRYEDHIASVSLTLAAGRLHAVATSGAGAAATDRDELHARVECLEAEDTAWGGSLEALLPRFSQRERHAVYSRASAAVRLGARRHLAHLLAVAEDRLEIVCAPGPTTRRPPRVLLDGRAALVDVSLSHDGPWIAWVAAAPPARAAP